MVVDEMKKIVICGSCRRPEYFGEMRWKSGRCSCRNCYKAQWEDENHAIYKWNDLDGERPSMDAYLIQENRMPSAKLPSGEICTGCEKLGMDGTCSNPSQICTNVARGGKIVNVLEYD